VLNNSLSCPTLPNDASHEPRIPLEALGIPQQAHGEGSGNDEACITNIHYITNVQKITQIHTYIHAYKHTYIPLNKK
jgi:hypothetical protein